MRNPTTHRDGPNSKFYLGASVRVTKDHKPFSPFKGSGHAAAVINDELRSKR